MRKPRNRPLKAFVKSGVLTIEIGIDTLAFAALCSPYAWELASESNRPDEVLRIGNKREFALDVVRELLDEAEDGSSLLTNLLDEATKRAIEQGSAAFADMREPCDIADGECLEHGRACRPERRKAKP